MTRERAAYSRVYWSIMDDPKFDTVRGSASRFGAWAMMLVVADMAYPAPAFIPPLVSNAVLTALEDAKLIVVLPGKMFRLVGLQAERERRSRGDQLGPSRDPLLLDETSTRQVQDETIDEVASQRATDDPAETYWALTTRWPSDKVLAWINDLTTRYGGDAVSRALVQEHLADRSARTLMGRTDSRVKAEARALDRKEQADEQARLREKRAIPKELPAWEQEFRAKIAERYAK